MKTARGIYLNLLESDYKFNYRGFTFYFSSEYYLKKFKESVGNFLNNETMKFEIKYKIDICLDIYFMISLYKKIEKRGFYIYDNISKKEITSNVSFVNKILSY